MKNILRYILPILGTVVFMATDAKERFFRNISEIGDYGGLTINCIYQDSTGYVWMASDRGVLRYDGIHSRLISFSDNDEPLFITSFAPLRDGNIAVGTRHGLSVIDTRGNISAFNDDTDEITSLVKWSPDTLLAGTTHGLKAYDCNGHNIRFNPLPVSSIYSPDSHIMTMTADSSGNIYIFTLSSLLRLDRTSCEYSVIYELPSPSDRPIEMVASENKVWVAMMSSGLWVFDIDKATATPIDINSPVVTSLCLSPHGDICIGTDGNGVYIIDPETNTVKEHIVHSLNRIGAPESNQVYSVMASPEGILWIGYYQHGADYSINNSGAFEVFNDPRYFNSLGMAIRTINRTDSYMAVGTRDGLLLMAGEKLRTIRRPDLNSDMVIAVHEYRGRLLIGTYGGGLSTYDLSSSTVSPFIPGPEIPFRRGHIFSITTDNLDRLWLGTSDGLFCFDGDTMLKHFTSSNSNMPAGNVYEMTFDSRGRGWVCTESGMCIYSPHDDAMHTDLFPANFINNNKIRTVYEDPEHTLYFLPERGPITYAPLNLDTISQLRFPALEGSDAKAITNDPHGNIWITTNRNIVRWNKKDEVIKFGLADGLPSSQFIQCTPSVHDNRMWFGNSNGLVVIDTYHDPHNSAIDRSLVPTAVSTDGNTDNVATINRTDSTSYSVRLDKFHTNVTLSFSPFTFTSPDAITYEYSLDGINWTPIPYNMQVDIYNTFTVRRFTLLVRPESNTSLTTTVKVSMPMGIAFKVIIVLTGIALLLILYIVYLTLRHLKARYIASRQHNDQQTVPSHDHDKPKYSQNPLSDEECSRLMKQVRNIMEKEHLFTNPDLKISTLSARTGISSHRLSQVFSQNDIRFYDFVNRYRVNEFKRIAAHGGAARYTLTAMAEKAGFSSRASFFRHFKEMEGISPGEYIKPLK